MGTVEASSYFIYWASLQGVLEAIRISLAGYPTRRTYSEFINRFGLLVPEHMDERWYFNIVDEYFGTFLEYAYFQ